ncbi:MAG TPA: 4'-phosphopantetheinyl transferase superfamily protein [Candidatus Binatia bacterium]|nr:4'-phosphopantetheinyl transferase superfamily protein [Candidatus Binatia bacterium]
MISLQALRGAPPAPRRANPARGSSLVQELFGEGVAAAELHGDADASLLLPEERACLGRAGAKRTREFAAGRLCARRALEELDVHGFALTVREDRAPRWPRGITGSITHSGRFCAAVAAPRTQLRALGLDAEIVGAVTRDIWSQLFAAAEIRWLERLQRREQAEVAALLFSAKEAFYKCQHAVTGQWLDFQDVTVDAAGWSLGAGVFAVRALGHVQLLEQVPEPWVGRFVFREGMVLTGIALPAR